MTSYVLEKNGINNGWSLQRNYMINSQKGFRFFIKTMHAEDV